MILHVFYEYEGGRKCFQILMALGWVFLSIYGSLSIGL